MKKNHWILGMTSVCAICSIFGNLIANAEVKSNLSPRSLFEATTAYRKYMQTEQIDINYESTPSYSDPYEIGILSEQTQNDILNLFNTYRYLAGLNSVSINSDESKASSAAALLCAVNGAIPEDINQLSLSNPELEALATKGFSESAILFGFASPQTAIASLIADQGNETLSNRRWCLAPTMEQTGFGISTNQSSCFSMYLTDHWNLLPENYVDAVYWPPQNMPLELYQEEDFSISLSNSYDNLYLAKVQVVVYDLTNQYTYIINKNSAEKKEDYSLSVNNQNCGTTRCLSFNFPHETNQECSYRIVASGMTRNGLAVLHDYNVNFFSAEKLIQSGIEGDYNNDSVMDSDDATMVLKQYTLSLIGEDAISDVDSAVRCDMDCNGVLDADDAVTILKKYAETLLG